jgi:type IX secretion system PorP/SprF family membrane protein
MQIINYKLEIKKLSTVLLLSFYFLLFTCSAQQTPQYTQFMLNNYGINPAACGAFSNKLDALMGVRRQWIGFDNAPVTSFLNVTTYFGRQGGGIKRHWHGVGFAWQGDRMGVKIKVDDFYGSYTFLMRLARTGFVSFGVAVGARRYGFRINDISDPILTAKNLWVYPDFIPGIKYFNNKWTLDLSVRQLYKNKVKQGAGIIGSPSKLSPHFYFSASRKWWPKSHLLVVQSLQVKYNFSSLPAFDYSMIAYLNKSFAVGGLYRHLDAIAAIVQYRFEKLVIGIAYEYSIAPYRVGFANTQEMMLGLSPSPFNGGGGATHYKTAECPTFKY